jgi:hypothetical protein
MTLTQEEYEEWEAKKSPPWDKWEDENHVCSVPGCGRVADDDGYPTLIYVTVLTCPGEEGYAEVTQCFCQAHFEEKSQALIDLGWASHNHHGTNLLDAEETCGGYGRCPTPAEYGAELVQPVKKSKPVSERSWRVEDEVHRTNGRINGQEYTLCGIRVYWTSEDTRRAANAGNWCQRCADLDG